MMHHANQPQYAVPQVQAVMRPPQVTPMEKYKSVLFYLGITEIVLGGLSFLLCVITLINGNYRTSLTWVSQGIWCGCILMVPGLLGVMTRSKPTRCMYNANMAMSIVTANFMCVLIILSGMAAALDSYGGVLVALHSIICLIGFAALIITIVHAAYCCAGVCCLENHTNQIVIVPPQGMIPVQMPNGQVMLQPQSANYTMPYYGGPVMNVQPPQGPLVQPLQSTSATHVIQTVQSSAQAPVYTNEPPAYTPDPMK